jgi:hypothetical protein
MKAFEFETTVEIPISVTVQWRSAVFTTRHVEGHKGYYEILRIVLPRNIENHILENNYESFQVEAEGME